jgi:hypothetical protein
MIDTAAIPVSLIGAFHPAYHDRVRVDDGREGTVIGFYRREVESVLVAFAGGESAEFFVAHVEPVWLASQAR